MVRAGREKLSGKVQVDDAFVGGEEPGVKGRQSFKKARIVVAVEIKEGDYGLGRIRIQHVPDFSATSLAPFVIHSVEEGSIVETDGWRGYNPIEEMGFQRIIQRVNSSLEDLLSHVIGRLLFRKRFVTQHKKAVASKTNVAAGWETSFSFIRKESER